MVRHLLETLEHLCETVEVDVVGNVYAVRKGPKEGPTVMIAAHTDEIGLMVKSIEPIGFIRFEKVGGVPTTCWPLGSFALKGAMAS